MTDLEPVSREAIELAPDQPVLFMAARLESGRLSFVRGYVMIEGAATFEAEAAWLAAMEADRVEHEPPPVAVVAVISMRQAKLQLSRAGLLDGANETIGTMTGQAGQEARIEWEYATELRRDHPLVAGIGEALKLTAEDIDGLFVEAAKIG